ncbi:hypothetical protein Ddc_00009 [Ditylenchus destructor]|nr:hypothetical protein Ddc_00009 [Ditylenchus destructor]
MITLAFFFIIYFASVCGQPGYGPTVRCPYGTAQSQVPYKVESSQVHVKEPEACVDEQIYIHECVALLPFSTNFFLKRIRASLLRHIKYNEHIKNSEQWNDERTTGNVLSTSLDLSKFWRKCHCNALRIRLDVTDNSPFIHNTLQETTFSTHVTLSRTVFLAVDRCLALNLTEPQIRKRISIFGIALLVLLYLASTAYYQLDIPLDLEYAIWVRCEHFTCLTHVTGSFLQHMVKISSGIITVICGIYFFYVCHKNGHGKNLKNRMVKLVIVSELFLNVIPNCMKYFFHQVLGISITWYLGEYGVLLCAVELTVHSVLYTRMFKGNWNPFVKNPNKVHSLCVA